MAQQEWQCPFCETTSSRPQGLAAHIRYGHAKQYQKWLKDPQRLAQALKTASATPPGKPLKRPPTPVPEPAEPRPAPGADNPTLELLNEAHRQLSARKRTIETELARFDELKKELETIDAQMQSLEQTLSIFQRGTPVDSPLLGHAAASAKGD